jgi:hypothetical protein
LIFLCARDNVLAVVSNATAAVEDTTIRVETPNSCRRVLASDLTMIPSPLYAQSRFSSAVHAFLLLLHLVFLEPCSPRPLAFRYSRPSMRWALGLPGSSFLGRVIVSPIPYPFCDKDHGKTVGARQEGGARVKRGINKGAGNRYGGKEKKGGIT